MSGRVAHAPGRVNLIGDHTDYTGGLVLPMAIDRETVVRVVPDAPPVVRLASLQEAGEAVVDLDVAEPSRLAPPWARYVGAVVAEVRPVHGWTGTVTSTVPVGAGLSSSAALEVACALALGADPGDALALARLCQRAEHRAVGVPSGIMDQLASVAGVAGAALLIDCHALSVTPAPLPPADEVEVVVVHSGQARTLAGSAYAERVAQCAAAEAEIGPLRLATVDDVAAIGDPLVRARARHVVTENARVRAFAAAMAAGDVAGAGRLMDESHASLAGDYAVSTPVLDALCDRLRSVPGVLGARLTGAGFGGCVVALCRPGALGDEGWRVRAVAGASVREDDGSASATAPVIAAGGEP
jgi:galactokinase